MGVDPPLQASRCCKMRSALKPSISNPQKCPACGGTATTTACSMRAIGYNQQHAICFKAPQP